MRALHRICALFAFGIMFYLGVTGTLIQSFDVHAVMTHAPATDPVMQAIREDEFGPGDFQVISARDYGAPALPRNLDYPQALTTVLRAAHQQSPGVAPRFVELRMLDGSIVGQVRLGDRIVAFDARTGAPVAPTESTFARFEPTAPSTRNYIRNLHRFWFNHDVPGVWVELICGIVLWLLIISAVVMYVRLLRVRAKLRKRQLFWRAGGWWRTLHRWVSVVAVAFIMMVAASGTWIAFESVWHHYAWTGPQKGEASSPLSDDEVLGMTHATLAAMRQSDPHSPIEVLRLRVYLHMKQGVVITGDDEPRQLVFDTDTGQDVGISQFGNSRMSGFPLGLGVHEAVKHFHSGKIFGLTTMWMDLLTGLSLIFFSISGLVMYLQLWLQRRKAGRGALIWV